MLRFISAPLILLLLITSTGSICFAQYTKPQQQTDKSIECGKKALEQCKAYTEGSKEHTVCWAAKYSECMNY